MHQKAKSLCLLAIFSSISQIFAAVMWDVELESNEFETAYIRSRQTSVHRGFVLSLSPEQKNEICQDFFYAQLYAATNPTSEENFSEISAKSFVTDDPKNQGKPLHPLTVGVLTDAAEIFPKDENFFFICAWKNFLFRIPTEKVHLISFTYRSGWFYISTLKDKQPADRLTPERYMSLSPELVSLEPDRLELQYINIRMTLDILESESPRYVQLIRKRDDLSALTDSKKKLTCASVLSSPVFRDKTRRLEFSPTRMTMNKEKLDYIQKRLLFGGTNSAHNNKWKSGCIPCEGYTHDDDEFTESTMLYLAPSFDDKDSLYLLEEFEGGIYVDLYFINVPMLKNLHEPIAEHSVFKNYNFY